MLIFFLYYIPLLPVSCVSFITDGPVTSISVSKYEMNFKKIQPSRPLDLLFAIIKAQNI